MFDVYQFFSIKLAGFQASNSAYRDNNMALTQKNDTKYPEKSTCYVRNPNIAERSIDDTVFLVDPETDIVFYLNPLSTGIWQLLHDSISEFDVASIIQHAFPDVPQKEIARDLTRLINEMRKKNLVWVCDNS